MLWKNALSQVACLAGASRKKTGRMQGDTRVSLARPFLLAPMTQVYFQVPDTKAVRKAKVSLSLNSYFVCL